jgi:hypothetical protein
MGNQQASAQFRILMENINLEELDLKHPKFIGVTEKYRFVRDYYLYSLDNQALFYKLKRGTMKSIRRRFMNYILSKPLPKGFVPLYIKNKISRYIINIKGVVLIRENLMILKNSIDRKGYVRVNVSYKDEVHNIKYFRLHRLVAKTFIGNPENKEQVNHKDGNKLNNHATNLEWNTNMENMKHAVLFNLRPSGENCKLSKLKEIDVIEIKNSDKDVKYLSKLYNVYPSTISNILSGHTWKNVHGFNDYRKDVE